MRKIFLLSVWVVCFACSEDPIPEKSFIPMNPDTEGKEPIENPYWAWTDKFPGTVSQELVRVKDTLVTVKGGYEPFAFDDGAAVLQSTGLYAPLGEVIEVEVPEGIVGLHYQIGIHARKLANAQVQLRYKDVAVKGELLPGKNQIMNWFGGYIFFYYPAGEVAASDIQVKVSGGVPTGDFILGKTDWKKWLQDKVDAMRPDTTVQSTDILIEPSGALRWTEMHSDKVILSIGSNELNEITNPETILNLYGNIIDSYYDFKGLEYTSGQMPVRVYSDLELPDPTQTPASPATKKWYVGEYPLAFIRGENDGNLVDEGRILDPALLKAQTSPKYNNWVALFNAFNNMFRSEWEKAPLWKDVTDRISYYYYSHRNGLWPGKFLDFKSLYDIQANPASAKFYDLRDAEGRMVMMIQLVNYTGWELFPYVCKQCREFNFVSEWRQDGVDFFAMCASEYAGCNLIPFFEFWKIELSQYAMDYMKQFPEAEPFWTTFDANKMADFTPRTPDLSHAATRGPKPKIVWADRTSWGNGKAENMRADGTKIDDLKGRNDKDVIENMFDGDPETLYMPNKLGPKKVKINRARTTVEFGGELTFNAIYYRSGSGTAHLAEAIEIFEIWEDNKWVKVNTSNFGIRYVKPNGSLIKDYDHYFYLPATYTSTKFRFTVLPQGVQDANRSFQISEFNLGLYAASDSGGGSGPAPEETE